MYACLSSFTVDHAPLSKQSTVPPPKRDTSNIWAPITCFSTYHESFLPTLSPSCFAFCGHHLSLRIAIVSLLFPNINSVLNFSIQR